MRVVCTGAWDLDGYTLGEPTRVGRNMDTAIITQPGASIRFLEFLRGKKFDCPALTVLLQMYERDRRPTASEVLHGTAPPTL